MALPREGEQSNFETKGSIWPWYLVEPTFLLIFKAKILDWPHLKHMIISIAFIVVCMHLVYINFLN